MIPWRKSFEPIDPGAEGMEETVDPYDLPRLESGFLTMPREGPPQIAARVVPVARRPIEEGGGLRHPEMFNLLLSPALAPVRLDPPPTMAEPGWSWPRPLAIAAAGVAALAVPIA